MKLGKHIIPNKTVSKAYIKIPPSVIPKLRPLKFLRINPNIARTLVSIFMKLGVYISRHLRPSQWLWVSIIYSSDSQPFFALGPHLIFNHFCGPLILFNCNKCKIHNKHVLTNRTFTYNMYYLFIMGESGSVVGWGTIIQAGRTRVRIPMSLYFSISLTLPAHYGTGVYSMFHNPVGLHGLLQG
jgi:hypothetical protein